MNNSAQPTKAPQGREALLKSYNKRLKDDVKSILDNFMGMLSERYSFYQFYIYIFQVFFSIDNLFLLNFPEIVKLGTVEDESQVARITQVEEINFQMNVRAANMVSHCKLFYI